MAESIETRIDERDEKSKSKNKNAVKRRQNKEISDCAFLVSKFSRGHIGSRNFNQESDVEIKENSYNMRKNSRSRSQVRNDLTPMSNEKHYVKGNKNLDYSHRGRQRSQSLQTKKFNSQERVRTTVKDVFTSKFMSFRYLKGLSCEDQDEIVRDLASNSAKFKDLLHSSLRPDQIILIMKLLGKVCECEFINLKTSVLSIACRQPFLEKIQQYIYSMPTDKSKERKESTKSFIFDLISFFEAMLSLFPNTAKEHLGDLFITTDLMMRGVETYHGIDLTDAKCKFAVLQVKLQELLNQLEETVMKVESEIELEQYELPPDNFRERNVWPTVEDILSDQPVFLRHNIVKGAYQNVEHYLDVQFRLLQEDFIEPLRSGINTYIAQSKSKEKFQRIDNIRIYHDVTFGNPKLTNCEIGVEVYFDPRRRLGKINWEYAKRFMYGSLLCFSNDNFKSIIFGTVAEKTLADLKQGKLTVVLIATNLSERIYETPCVMIESEVYFEPCKLVLQALQSISSNTFPMEKYIISVCKEISAPVYLQNHLRCEYRINRNIVNIFDVASWPSAEDLELDHAQYAAFQTALTKEFVIIQGPPGTGKTFLGLKIVEVLLMNKSYWNTEHTPILVVCYTNHALDQFLEGILHFTKSVTRIGGQSKSTVVAEHNIQTKRKRDVYRPNWLNGYKNEINYLARDMKKVQKNLEEIDQNKGIISVETLYDYGVIAEKHYKSFKPNVSHSFLNWLIYDKIGHGSPFESLKQTNATRVEHIDEVYDSDELIDVVDEMIKEEHSRRFADFYPFEFENVNSDLKYDIDINYLKLREENLMQEIYDIEQMKEVNDVQWRLNEYIYDCEMLQHLKDLIETCLKYNYKDYFNHLEPLKAVTNLWSLSPQNRWILYMSWIDSLKKTLRNTMEKLKEKYERTKLNFEEARSISDMGILHNSFVVGMTTTCAARLHSTLQALKPKIVIIEEAAEVLESHIIVSLTKNCQHLILIGDHQQLRPSTSVYKLAREYHLDVSLFERMINNGIDFCTLQMQHRMRPEISKLIIPSIYPNLRDHESVLKYSEVLGMEKSLFFMTHSQIEEKDNERSHKNTFEADFLLELCRYLVLQGYTTEEITILTAYRGQMFYMMQKKKRMSLINNVRVTVVDNFQGEENRIILLSLVRSNKEKNVGFLKMVNRVCVALSRAKEGLYIIGNMDNLISSSNIWSQIQETFIAQNSYGSFLTLKCQVHSYQQTLVSKAEDFVKVPEGGCSLLCETALVCGHECTSVCHVTDREHKIYKCFKKCERVPQECSLGHPCTKLCYMDCGECETIVERILPCKHTKALKCHVNHEEYKCKEMLIIKHPDCGHEVKKLCFEDIAKIPCSWPCENRLECGHSCVLNCHPCNDPDHLEYKCSKPCARINKECSETHLCSKLCYEECGTCVYEVKRILPCGHQRRVKCSEDLSAVICNRKCERKLQCGHKCPKLCFEICGDCPVKVKKTIPQCGHEVTLKCSVLPDPKRCSKPCKRTLNCGHQCSNKCGETCNSKCYELTRSLFPSICGHEVDIPCYMQNKNYHNTELFLENCKEPCAKELSCGHHCKGTCGKCMQGRIHIACEEKCERNLICGHKCKTACSRACPPCTSKCSYKCQHSKCAKRCGEPCIPCKEKCTWQCAHKSCTKPCGELCNREPCYEPCERKLKCGHPCIGFCGDPCPPLCRICNKDEVTELFFGTEDEEDARFVYLVDCKHVLESSGLEHWIKPSEGGEITLKTCPRCTTQILSTKRFMNYVKLSLLNINLVKWQLFGIISDIEQSRKELLTKLKALDMSGPALSVQSHNHSKLINMCEQHLLTVRNKRRNNLSSYQIENLRTEINIIEHLIDSQKILKSVEGKDHLQHYDFLLSKLIERHGNITSQEAMDFNRECIRFERMIQLIALRNNAKYYFLNKDTKAVKYYDEVHAVLYSTTIYTENIDIKIKYKLKKLEKLTSLSLITDDERNTIVRAIGLSQGHWFKCPNGHIYCIGECGGAMEKSKCPECKEDIGGTNHRLLPTNRLASEMDGASRHAWEGGLY